MSQGCSRKKGIGVELKSIKIRLVGGVSLDIHMDCTIKKDKIVLVVPPFSSSVPHPPNTLFSGTALMIKEILCIQKMNNVLKKTKNSFHSFYKQQPYFSLLAHVFLNITYLLLSYQ